MRKDLILRIGAKLILPFILLFALYVQFHGDFGPGGGFQAGVISAAMVILYAIIFWPEIRADGNSTTVCRIDGAAGRPSLHRCRHRRHVQRREFPKLFSPGTRSRKGSASGHNTGGTRRLYNCCRDYACNFLHFCWPGALMQILETIVGHYNQWITVFLMVSGLYIVIARGNMVKKLVGLSIFQTSVYLLYLSPGKILGGTAPIIDPNYTVYSNPLPHVLILTAIVVGVGTLALGLALVVRINEEFGTIEEDELFGKDDDI